MAHKILCTIGEEFTPEAKRILEHVGAVDYRIPSQGELQRIIGNYTAAVVQLGLHLDAETLQRAKRLKAIATATTSADHIDVAAAKKLGIEVLSLKGNTTFLKTVTSTAEHTWGLLLCLLRRIIPASEAVRRGQWESPPFRGNELQGKTLGIIGVGRLGEMVARYGKSFGMEVIGCDPEHIPKSVCRQVSLRDLLKWSDVVSLHVHLSEETEGLISARELALMKPTAVLLNTARGKIVDERALLSALKTKRLAGYAADVLADEVTFGQNCSRDPLVRYAKTHTNVLLTPHIGGRTDEARSKTDIFIAERLRKFLDP